MSKYAPTTGMRLSHEATVMSVKQAQRLLAGRTESRPSDWAQPTDEMRRLTAARRAVEDRAVLRELGLA